ncbi:DUF4468 domain-containing protein [Algoriphagus ratkowskyi]|nr:DUF4468 domain-containing protein [Algoriphagus ratkowskyi]
MKKILIPSICILIPFILTSCLGTKNIQQSPSPKIATFENGLDKNDNYVLANEWMVEAFNDATSVIQFTDKESGTVKGKYLLKAGSVSTSPYVSSTDPLHAIITIRARDNKIRIEIDPPSSGFYSQSSMGNEYGYTIQMFDKTTSNLVEDFQSRMKGKSTSEW